MNAARKKKVGRPKKSASDRASRRITVRLDAVDERRLQKLVKLLGTTEGETLRHALRQLAAQLKRKK